MKKVTKETMCPCCGKVLYALGPVAQSVAGVANGPKVESDQHGHFMRCPHCSKRVILQSTKTPVGAGFALATTQTCVLIR